MRDVGSYDPDRQRQPLKAADAARREGEPPTAQIAGSARQTPHPRVALSRASESVQGAAKASPGGHQDDGYWRSLRASLIAADDLLTLAVARQGPEPSCTTTPAERGKVVAMKSRR